MTIENEQPKEKRKYTKREKPETSKEEFLDLGGIDMVPVTCNITSNPSTELETTPKKRQIGIEKSYKDAHDIRARGKQVHVYPYLGNSNLRAFSAGGSEFQMSIRISPDGSRHIMVPPKARVLIPTNVSLKEERNEYLHPVLFKNYLELTLKTGIFVIAHEWLNKTLQVVVTNVSDSIAEINPLTGLGYITFLDLSENDVVIAE